MARLIVRRLLLSIFVVLGVTTMVFVVMHLSGDPALLMLPPEATHQDLLEYRHRMGLDRPLIVQFWSFLTHAVRGDFGTSVQFHEPGMRLVLDRLPATIQLTVAALAISSGLALPLGILSAVRRNTIADHVAMLFALFGQSMPVFWLGIVFILVFSVRLGWLPSSGSGKPAHLILPALTLGLYTTARLTRVVRAQMLEVLGTDYLRTAYAKGLSNIAVIVRHAFRNASLPVITILGIEIGAMLGGAVITETVFAWPGVGQLVVNAINNSDYPIVQAAVFVIAVIFVLVNLSVDILYTVIDPRIEG